MKEFETIDEPVIKPATRTQESTVKTFSSVTSAYKPSVTYLRCIMCEFVATKEHAWKAAFVSDLRLLTLDHAPVIDAGSLPSYYLCGPACCSRLVTLWAEGK